MSDFFVNLLSSYGLRLQHLPPHSIFIVAIFAHLCKGLVGVKPSVPLFRQYFQLKRANKTGKFIGGYYFQLKGSHGSQYPVIPKPGKWDSWPSEWAAVRVPRWGACNCLMALPPHIRSSGRTPQVFQRLGGRSWTVLRVWRLQG